MPAGKGASDNTSDLSLFSTFIESIPVDRFPDLTTKVEGGPIYISLPTEVEQSNLPPGTRRIAVTNSLSGLTLKVRVHIDCLAGHNCDKVYETLIFNLIESHEHIKSCPHCRRYAHRSHYQANNSETA